MHTHSHVHYQLGPITVSEANLPNSMPLGHGRIPRVNPGKHPGRICETVHVNPSSNWGTMGYNAILFLLFAL